MPSTVQEIVVLFASFAGSASHPLHRGIFLRYVHPDGQLVGVTNM